MEFYTSYIVEMHNNYGDLHHLLLKYTIAYTCIDFLLLVLLLECSADIVIVAITFLHSFESSINDATSKSFSL